MSGVLFTVAMVYTDEWFVHVIMLLAVAHSVCICIQVSVRVCFIVSELRCMVDEALLTAIPSVGSLEEEERELVLAAAPSASSLEGNEERELFMAARPSAGSLEEQGEILPSLSSLEERGLFMAPSHQVISGSLSRFFCGQGRSSSPFCE